MRSAISSTSSSLWLMNTIDLPSSPEPRRLSNSSEVSAGVKHRGWLVQDQDLDAAIQRLQDLDPLLLAHREGLDDRRGVDLEPVGVREFGDLGFGPFRSRIGPPSMPRMMFSATVKGSTRTKC